jgi:hypothetical protein
MSLTHTGTEIRIKDAGLMLVYSGFRNSPALDKTMHPIQHLINAEANLTTEDLWTCGIMRMVNPTL